MLHKDTSWIWISRDEAKVNRQQEIVMTSTGTISGSNNNSPIFSSSVANCSAALHTEHCIAVRPHQFGGRQGNATAVLSVGEADMLLLHSPYHHAASPDEMYTSQVKRSTHCISDSFKTETLNRAHPSDNIWPIIGCGIHETEGAQTLGNHGRRHTTGAMTQRNYQGQECSIRIISNPISQQTNSAHTNRNRLLFKGCDIDTLATSTKFTCPVQGELLIGPEVVQLHPGYSSASISRRRKKDSTHIWTSHTASRHPPPTHPAPPIPAGHLDAYHHYQKSDASMCRSWIHEKPIDQLPSNQVDYISDQMIKPRGVQEHLCTEEHLQNSLKTTISPWNIRRAEKLSHKATTVNETDKASFGESSLGTSDYGSYLLNVCDSFESKIFEKKENSCAPHPPLRTTSRSLACRTLQSRRADKLPAVCAQRPMSLPQ
ncbi:unnamed protein product, partial [Dicrocoelium dendriticum]